MPSEELILGGVIIPADFGTIGHSDADVLIHAIIDALLGALALGDIGQHFPDSDPAYKGIRSRIMLERVVELVHKEGYNIVNIDSTVILQKPKIAGYIPQMRQLLAEVTGLELPEVSVKATTTEQLGFEGRGEGIAAQAVVLLSSNQ